VLTRVRGPRSRGQALTEFALVFPILLLFLFGIIVWGLGVFYQAQLQNAAREGARYAAIHSSEAQCPTISNDPFVNSPPFSFGPCDTPAAGWPFMTAAARQKVWGVDASQVKVSACWSSYQNGSTYDLPPVDASGSPNTLARCTYARVENNPSSLPCPPVATTASDDEGTDNPRNQVSVYTCLVWQPPLAGFLLIPTQVTMRAVVTEVIHKQQG
jgi:TadE-like protein